MKVASLRKLHGTPFRQLSFLYREATEIVFWPSFFSYFVICLFPTKLGRKKEINNSYFILFFPNGCLASKDSICTGRYLAILVIFVQADIERLLLLLHTTVATSTKLWLHVGVQFVSMQTHLSRLKFFLPQPLT